METGIDSFAAAYDDSSIAVSPSDRLRNLIEQIEHADQVGLDVFGIGEHHRKEYLDSAPTVILGAAAARTQRIRLTSAVTVLSAADPVRVFQNFATLDLLSRGREAGRQAGCSRDRLKVGLHSLGYVAATTQEAADDYFPGYARAFSSVGKERGWGPVSRAQFDAQLGPNGALLIGTAEEVVEKIMRHSKALGGISRVT